MAQVSKGMSYKAIRRKKRKRKVTFGDDESEYINLNNNLTIDEVQQKVTPNVCPPPMINILNY